MKNADIKEIIPSETSLKRRILELGVKLWMMIYLKKY